MLKENLKTIDLRIVGGLGNQLFQFSALTYIFNAINNESKKIFIDTSYLMSYEAKHSYDIGFITKFFPDMSMSMSIGRGSSRLAYAINKFRFAKLIDNRIGSIALISSTEHLKKACLIDNYANHYFLDDYFQSYETLFEENKRLEIRNSLIKEKWSLISGIKNGVSCIGVHIRRGDYVLSKSASRVYRQIPVEYYLNALELLPKKNRIIVFSDDAQISAEFAQHVGGIDARQLNLSTEDEFCLLMACENHVIANSTFSWWAAYLGHHPDGKIISPNSWFIDVTRNSSNPLLLPYFHCIEN